MFAAEIGRKYMLNLHAVDHEGEVLDAYVSNYRDRKSVLKFLRKSMKCFRAPEVVVSGKLNFYGAAMKLIGNAD
jgi:putative transposase